MLTVLAFASTAWAGVHRVALSRTTSRSPDHVLSVLTAYADTCHTGCRYHREGLIVTHRLSYQATKGRWFAWTQLRSQMREVTYFSITVLERTEDGGFVMENRQLDSTDQSLIVELERDTGLRHRPAFDAGTTTTIVKPLGPGTVQIHRAVLLVSSGVLALWPSRIEQEIRNRIETTFRNIEL